ncbi:MAG: YihY family inner membrane protein [Alphaproteobacteria bacterium]|nr:YihY family inner membrane protein [Alphaproteobacteria bacterium]MBV9016840.1 YihY family inner membrane protein [Alphaproteobacteria bacterium]MBV9585168.1 YihY family inner membrane protein [Alphaproteobacteria bacterium]
MQQADQDRRAGFTVTLRQKLAAAGTFSRYALHRFNRDGCFAASGALSYTTLVSLVPLGVIALGILSAFPNFAGVQQELLDLVFRNFVPAISTQAAWWFQYFAGSAAQATAIGIVGIAGTGVLMLVTVEDQLNALWRVTTARPWGQRVLAYWTLITLGPLLVGMSLTLSTYLDTAARRAGFDPDAFYQLASGWPHWLARAIPFLLELIACTLLYCIIPNCSVRWRDGLAGAAVAALAIEILKIGFSFYIGAMSSYQTVYGAIAAIPIFLLWMYVSWMAVMLGAVVAANLPTWRVDERFAHLSTGGVRLGFSLALIAALARAQRRGDTCRTATLAADLGVATTVIDEHLQQLAHAGFAAPTQAGGWVLAWNPETATLHDLYEALDLPLAGRWRDHPVAPWQVQVAPAMERIVKAETAAMRVTLADLLADVRGPAPSPIRAIAAGSRRRGK